MSNKIKHFFEYLDYDKLNAEDNSFQRPKKNKKGIFLAMLTTPYKFYLPKSELCDMFQDSYGNNMINYIINLDSHAEIVRFLENFDSLCISNAANNSESWFGKELNTEKLIKYYNTLYELSEDEKSLYLPISVENSDIENIINYNEDDTNILSVKIVGIEFFQQTFRWQIKFNSIVDSIDESDDEDEVNFDVLVGGNIPVQEIEKHFTSVESPRSLENEDNTNIASDDCVDESKVKPVYDEYESDISEEQYKHNNEDTYSYNEIEYNKEDTSDNEQSYQEDNSSIDAESSDDESDTNQYKEDEQEAESQQYNDYSDLDNEEVESQNELEVESHNELEVESQNEIEVESQNELEVEPKVEQDAESQVESDVESQENIERVSNNSYSHKYNDKQEDEEIKSIDKDLVNQTEENITLNKSMINDLANEVAEQNTTNNILHNDTIQEIESIISEKRLTEKKYLMNANRAQRALDTLSTKANEVTKEIELYENKLRECQQIN